MVDYEPFLGNFANVVVQNNAIAGGFATDPPTSANETKGEDKYLAIIKSVELRLTSNSLTG